MTFWGGMLWWVIETMLYSPLAHFAYVLLAYALYRKYKKKKKIFHNKDKGGDEK